MARPTHARRGPRPSVARLRVRGFRSAHDVSLDPGGLCALVGEANSGKSNLLLAIRALLDPGAPGFAADDAAPRDGGRIEIDGTLVGSGELSLVARPPARAERAGAAPPAVAFLPGDLRSSTLLAPFGPDPAPALARFDGLVREALSAAAGRSAAGPAGSFLAALRPAGRSGCGASCC